MGVEPTVPFGTPDFESGTFGHSVISPAMISASCEASGSFAMVPVPYHSFLCLLTAPVSIGSAWFQHGREVHEHCRAICPPQGVGRQVRVGFGDLNCAVAKNVTELLDRATACRPLGSECMPRRLIPGQARKDPALAEGPCSASRSRRDLTKSLSTLNSCGHSSCCCHGPLLSGNPSPSLMPPPDGSSTAVRRGATDRRPCHLPRLSFVEPTFLAAPSCVGSCRTSAPPILETRSRSFLA